MKTVSNIYRLHDTDVLKTNEKEEDKIKEERFVRLLRL